MALVRQGHLGVGQESPEFLVLQHLRGEAQVLSPLLQLVLLHGQLKDGLGETPA